MVVRFTGRVDSEKVNRALDSVRPALSRRLHAAVLRDLRGHENRMIARLKRGDQIKARRGAAGLAGSFNHRIAPSVPPADPGRIRGAVFSAGQAHARIQELGGVVVPKVKKKLAIPPPWALTPNSRLKAGYFLREVNETGPRGGKIKYRTDRGERTHIVKKGANLYVVAENTGVIRILKDRVVLRPRLGFFDTWRKDEPARRRRRSAAVRRALEDATDG